MKRNILNSPRLLELKRRRRKVILKRSFFVGFFLCIILVGASLFSHLDSFNISKTEIVGNKIIDTEIIQGIIDQELVGNYFWIFPKTNIFFYPKNKIKEELSIKIKRLENIILSIKEREMLVVSVEERDPKYTWCGATIPSGEEGNKPCYFLDQNGYIFDQAPYFSGDIYFKFYGLVNQTDDIPSGNFFFEPNFKNFILFKETLEDMELKPTALYLGKGGETKVFLSNESSKSTGPEIIFKTDSDFQQLAENLQTALSVEPLLSDFKKKYSTLLYIDLRFGNKVYYKFSTQGGSVSGGN